MHGTAFVRHSVFVSLVLAFSGCAGGTTSPPDGRADRGAAESPAQPVSDSSARGVASSSDSAGQNSQPATDEKSAVREENPSSSPKSTEDSSADPTSDPLTGFKSLRTVLTAEDVQDGWIALFDGHSLFGWKPNSDANWTVKDGVVTADSGKPGLLVTPVRFADFELRCDYRLAKGGNSGIFLRTAFEPKSPAKDCYELNMCDTHPMFRTASLVARAQPTEAVVGEDGEWHHFDVRCEGSKIVVKFDGKQALDFDDTSENALSSGYIGLQMNGGKVEFRSVFLKPLSMKPLFNGEDLSGWKTVPGSKSTFDVVDGAIHLDNGPGFLETEGTYADFVLQGQARTNGDRLNSGIFFRAMPGTEKAPSNGYEFQIQNGFNKGDRTQPADFGTGAIFRRAKARLVIPNDREWFTLTLVADGPTFATWVDGYPVVVWTDDRKPDENPRNGKRLDAGHLSLQGHDPTTNLDFRALRITDLPGGE